MQDEKLRVTRRHALATLAGSLLAACGGGGGGDTPGSGGTGTPATGQGPGTGGTRGGAAFSAFGPVRLATDADFPTPAVARLAGGGSVVFRVERGTGTARVLMGQRLDAAGALQGPAFVVREEPNGLYDVVAAPQADGGFLVAWLNADLLAQTAGATVIAVRTRRYEADGSLVGESIVTPGLVYAVNGLGLVPTADGAVIAWSARVARTAPHQAFLRRLDGSGAPAGGVVTVTEALTGDQEDVSLAVLADGTVLAAWQLLTPGRVTYDVQTRHFAADLTPLSPAATVDGSQDTARMDLSVAPLPDGNAAVAWASTNGTAVRSAVVTPAGAVIAAPQAITAAWPVRGVVAVPRADGFGVAWQEFRGGPREGTMWLRLQPYASTGEPAGAAAELVPARLTFWVSPTVGTTVSTGEGFALAGGADSHVVGAFHGAMEQPETYAFGR